MNFKRLILIFLGVFSLFAIVTYLILALSLGWDINTWDRILFQWFNFMLMIEIALSLIISLHEAS